MRLLFIKLTVIFFLIIYFNILINAGQTIRIASKNFNESYILAEVMAQLLESRGYNVERQFGLGGTLICYKALINGAIDIYPEYSGTIEQAILKIKIPISYLNLKSQLKQKYKLELLKPFGFNNTYALAVGKGFAKRHHLKSISDLKSHSNLRYGFSYEFLERTDGWKNLAKTYKLTAKAVGMEHSISYKALAENQIDAINVYSTDAEINKYNLLLLKDDKQFFPTYLAAALVRTDLDENAKNILNELADKINEKLMQQMNAEVAINKKSSSETARDFLITTKLIDKHLYNPESFVSSLIRRVIRHFMLTGIALFIAIIIAIPFGIIIYRIPLLSKPIIYISGLLQTIPSIALLAFMIPLFGIGVQPAIIALIVYAFLPILRNTYIALYSIDPKLKKVSAGMGLTTTQQLRYIELPLAMPNILAGISTAAVISIGTATLAAFIGAGGLGEPIVTGLALNDPLLIMQGAIPAAIMAILVELFFELLQKLLFPKHLLQKQDFK